MCNVFTDKNGQQYALDDVTMTATIMGNHHSRFIEIFPIIKVYTKVNYPKKCCDCNDFNNRDCNVIDKSDDCECDCDKECNGDRFNNCDCDKECNVIDCKNDKADDCKNECNGDKCINRVCKKECDSDDECNDTRFSDRYGDKCINRVCKKECDSDDECNDTRFSDRYGDGLIEYDDECDKDSNIIDNKDCKNNDNKSPIKTIKFIPKEFFNNKSANITPELIINRRRNLLENSEEEDIETNLNNTDKQENFLKGVDDNMPFNNLNNISNCCNNFVNKDNLDKYHVNNNKYSCIRYPKEEPKHDYIDVCDMIKKHKHCEKFNNKIDYSKVDYSKVDYNKIDYSKVDYSKLDYSKIDYSKVDYSKLDYSKLDYSKINYCKIDYSKIDYAKIDYAKINYCKIDYSKLDYSKVDYSKIDYSKVDYSKLDYSKADYNKIDYNKADYSKLDYSKVNYDDKGKTYTVVFPDDCKYLFADNKNLIVFILHRLRRPTTNITCIKGMFSGCTSLRKLEIRHLNIDNVRKMGGFIHHCKNIEGLDIEQFLSYKHTGAASTIM